MGTQLKQITGGEELSQLKKEEHNNRREYLARLILELSPGEIEEVIVSAVELLALQ